MKISFSKLVKISLIIVYLVILAGSVVRMTGSGMGCPDWPKCFGYLIPPTERSQLEWKKLYEYKKGQIIIRNQSLRVAKHNFISSEEYKDQNWNHYTKHDYADFDVNNTWTEYVNRLLGALSGIAVLLMTIASLKFWRVNKKLIIISVVVLIGLFLEAWIGKEVVDSNLAPLKISIHLIVALMVVFGLINLLYLSDEKIKSIKTNSLVKRMSIVLLLMTLIEIIIGIQVREFVDSKMNQPIETWLNILPEEFLFHRSFSVIIIGFHLYLYYKLKKLDLLIPLYKFILTLISIEICIGIVMYYFSFPFLSQPLHLLIASLLFGAQSLLILKLNSKK